MRHDTEPLPTGAIGRLGARNFSSGFGLHGLAWSADGTRLAAATGRGVTLFETREGRAILSVVGNESLALHPFSVAFADGGAAIVAFGRDGFLRRWSTDTGELRFAHPAEAFTGRLSPDGAVLLCVPRDSATRVMLDARTGATIRALDGAIRNGAQRIAWSADGALVATATHLSGEIELWDARSGERLRAFRSDDLRLDDIALSPDGRFVAGGGNNGVAYVWRADDGARVLEAPALFRREHAPCGVALGRGGAFALCAGDVIVRYDLAGGAAPVRVEPGGACVELAYAPDGAQLAFRGNHCIRRIDCRLGEEIDDGPRMRSPVAAAGLSPDGARAVLLGAQPDSARPVFEVREWSLDKAVITGGSGFSQGHADVAPDGSLVASERDGALSICAPNGALVHRWSGALVTRAPVAFEPDGRGVRFTHTHEANRCRFDLRSATVELVGARTERSPDGALRIEYVKGDRKPWRVHDEASNARVATLASPAQHGVFVAWSRAGDTVLTLSLEGNLRTCDARTGKVVGRTVRLLSTAIDAFTTVRCATMTPDGRWLIAGDSAGRVVVVDLDASAVRCVFEGHEGPVFCVRASADGKTLLSGGADTTAVRWAMPAPAPKKTARAASKRKTA